MLMFNINPEKKIVVAYFQNDDGKYMLRCLSSDLYDYLYKLENNEYMNDALSLVISTRNNSTRRHVVAKFMKKYAYENLSVMGVAKCSGDDEFDETVGMRIAKAKLEKKEREIFRKFRKFLYEEAVKGLDSFKNRLGDFEDK